MSKNNTLTYGKLKEKVDSISLVPDDEDIQDEEVWAVINSFVEQNGLNSAQIHSFNDFIHNGIQNVLDIPNIKHTHIEYNGKTYDIDIGERYILSPKYTELNGESHVLYPMEALWRNTTYASEIYADITITPPSGEPTHYEKVHLGNTPVLVGSDLCNTSVIRNDPAEMGLHSEDILDHGGYFVIGSKSDSSMGSTAQRRVLVFQERIANNQIFIFKNRKQTPKFSIYTECHSTLTGTHMTTTTVGRIQNRISSVLPWIDGAEIPIGVLFRAFGIEDEKSMALLILGPKFAEDKEALDILTPVLEYSYECSTREAAYHFIGRRGRKFVKDENVPTDTDEVEDESLDSFEISDSNLETGSDETQNRQTKDRDSAISYAKHLLSVEVFSHIGQGEEFSHDKAMFLGYMIKKLIYVILGRRKPENRDHYANKRINTTGVLLKQQFHAAMRRLIMEITNSTLKALRQGHNVNITSWIKPTIVTNALQGAISNNTWNTGGNKTKGISQIYEQYNYAAGIANMRKVTLPIDGDGGKITEPRDLQGCHFGIMCVTGDTLVTMEDGSLKKISGLSSKADNILSIDPVHGGTESSAFFNFFSMIPRRLLCMETETGHRLRCTPNHPILEIKDGKKHWTDAGDLNDKSVVVMYINGCCTYHNIAKIYDVEPERVYDFTTISSNHSFVANGFVTHNCPSETPEGKKVGLVRNLALLCYITIGTDPKPVAKIVSTLIGMDHLEQFPESLDWTRIFINGTPMGAIKDPKKFCREMVKLRRSANIHPETSIAYHLEANEVHISTEAGRPCRPLLVVQDGELVLRLNTIESLLLHELSWSQLLSEGFVELIDKAEEEDALVIGYPSELKTIPDEIKIKVTHCELHPSMMYGVGGSIIAFPDHNQSPRNCYQAAMGKQAVGMPFTNYRQMMTGSFSTMRYLHSPIALSRAATIIGFDQMPAGQNAMTIIMPRIFNEEDSMEINSDSIDRGFMVSDKWVCYRAERKKEKGEIFGIPTEETCERFRGNSGKLNAEGFVPKGTIVEDGDILIGKMVEIRHDAAMTATGISIKKKYINASVKYEHPWPAVVDAIQIGRSGEGYEYIAVMTVQERIPVVGDKFAARHGQKGTVGKFVPAIDFPFNQKGMAPDICLNSIAFPSRMTIAMLIEMWAGKVVMSTSPLHDVHVTDMVINNTSEIHDQDEPGDSFDGEVGSEFKEMFSHPKHKHLIDATPFRKFDRHVIKEEMSKYGMALGDEYWTDGITGKPTRCFAFYGPCYIQRLKHMVVDKVHARARGPRTTLTRQPKEGRVAGGGLRIGTMERDCILGQGAARFARDRLMEQSDEFRTWVCNLCGLPAHVEQEGKIRECRVCSTTDVSKIKIPYGTKLMQQELMAENIVPRVLTVPHWEVSSAENFEDK